MMRLPELGREELSARGQQIYDGIVASRGGVRGPFAALMHSPEVAGRAAHLGTYLRFETSLDPMTLQIVTLAVAREWDCQYEWTAHEPQAREASVRDDTIAAIKERRAPEGLTKEEAVRVLSRVLDEKSFERATVLLYAKEHEVGENIKSSFDDINQWKGTRIYQ